MEYGLLTRDKSRSIVSCDMISSMYMRTQDIGLLEHTHDHVNGYSGPVVIEVHAHQRLLSTPMHPR